MQAKYPKLSGNDGKPFTITIDKFGKGVMTLFNASRLPIDAVKQAQNMYLDDDGVWTVRPGTAAYGAVLTTPIDGASPFTKYNTDGTTSTYIAVIDNGALKTSQDGGAWTTVSGMTWTVGKPVNMIQMQTRLYIANGTEALAYYDIAAGTIHTYTSLATPGAPAVTKTGGTGSSTAYYKLTAINEIGETIAGAEGSAGTAKDRDSWTLGTDYMSLTWSAVPSATRYAIYYSDQSGQEVYLDSTTSTSYIDYGTAIPNIYAPAPTTDTTAGPKYTQFALASNQLWATGDPTQPYRVAWTGTGTYLGAFDPFSGGGFIDLEKGGKEKPVAVKSFRDGKGNSVATVLTSDPNGGGSIWAITLGSIVIDSIQIPIPSYSKQQGSVGTRSPYGVVEYNNTIYYPSPKGFQSLGSRQSILNVLVTQDIASDVRDSVDGINNQYAHLTCGVASKGRVYWSVPFGTTTNNQTWVLDLERGGVWALPWTIGVKRFLEYTDSSGTIRLLGIPTTGSYLIAFDQNVSGDSGVAFSSSLQSGLVHWDKDHTTWAYIKDVYFELADPSGAPTASIIGVQKNKSAQTLGTRRITDTTSDSGFDADLFGNFLYDTSGETPNTFSQNSVIKKITINKLLNYLQWQLAGSGINDRYSLMQVVIKGVMLPTSDPSSYKT